MHIPERQSWQGRKKGESTGREKKQEHFQKAEVAGEKIGRKTGRKEQHLPNKIDVAEGKNRSKHNTFLIRQRWQGEKTGGGRGDSVSLIRQRWQEGKNREKRIQHLPNTPGRQESRQREEEASYLAGQRVTCIYSRGERERGKGGEGDSMASYSYNLSLCMRWLVTFSHANFYASKQGGFGASLG